MGMRPGTTLWDYANAPAEGPLHDEWKDKPHRLLYDLVDEIRNLREKLAKKGE
jgi:hypothetical protein